MRNEFVISTILAAILWLSLPTVGLAQQQNLHQKFSDTQDSIKALLYMEPKRALEFAEHFYTLAQNQDSLFYKAKAENFIGMCRYVLGDVEPAIEAYTRALKAFEAIGDQWYIAMLNNNIGAAYQLRNKPYETISYFQTALKGFEALRDSAWMANILANIAVQYNLLGKLSESQTHFERALHMHEAMGNEDMAFLIKGNLASIVNQSGRPKEALALADAYLASPYADADLVQKTNVLITSSKAHFQLGNHTGALSRIQAAIAIAEQGRFVEQLANATAHAAEVHAAMKNYAMAYETFRRYHALSDSLFSREKDERITELLTQYDVEKKENEISLLQKDKAIARRNQWLFALTALVLLIASLGIWALYQNRQRGMRRLEEKNRIISKMLEEKEFLIKEIHHRVKNNLQVISSLLQLQSRYVDEPTALAALSDGESRVRSMSIIHHHLYTGDNLSQVDVPKYIDNLCESLLASYNFKKKDIAIHREIGNLALDVSVMIPLGLIINELITNAFKYAFEGRERGNIRVRIKELDGQLLVSVKDDGIGINPEKVKKGFGARLINTFLRKLEAEAETISGGGTEVRIAVKRYRKEEALGRMSA